MAICVGGGPAPGINSVIGAATIRASLSGVPVIGVRDGFQWLMKGDIEHVRPLTIEGVSRIHFRGGSIIGISRSNPTKDEKHLENTVISLLRLNVDRLITIGGDDTAYTALRLSQQAQGRIRVAHVPKTIDNDLDLPEGIPTFGFQTARHVGVGIVRDLQVDAYTTSRWYFIITMGRKAGHLALGIGKAAGATLAIIPEEFSEPEIRLSRIVDTLAGAIIKRLSYGRSDGTAVIAEGLVERLHPDDLKGLTDVERDAHDNLRIAEVNFGELLKSRVQARLKELGLKSTIVAKNIGYELRCTDPIPYDMEYTRDLGYCAAEYLLEGGTDALVTIHRGKFRPLQLTKMIDPITNRMRIRMVDIGTEHYRVARRYMLRLRRDDFEDAHELAKLAATAHLSLEDFQKQFEYLIEDEPEPIVFVPGYAGPESTPPPSLIKPEA
jgi:6-phosphofructokinase